ncbi:MAG: amino-acid N-acetyltransferase [Gammaproteobacteria bacterium]|jgi:amino-acid N-acetyltransferase|nr:amino-acid N-acetyltransferase [Gammaproteobacteria bacterium]
MPLKPKNQNNAFVQQFRESSPYINSFRGKTFVIVFNGEAVDDPQFPHLIHDIALLDSLGIRLILVHGARPQIEQRLAKAGAKFEYVDDLRITDDLALQCVKEAVGTIRVEVESLLSMGLANSPMAGAQLQVVSGNFVTAKPVGIREGIDFLHTGEVRKINAAAIAKQLADNTIVLLPPVGYSPTGEVFNLSAEDVATAVSIALKADKLIYLTEDLPLQDARKRTIRELTLAKASDLLDSKTKLPNQTRRILRSAVRVCSSGVRRVHVISRRTDGAILQELFTRDGIGTLVSADLYEGTRQAHIEDVAGILDLISPLEQEGILVRRSREKLEMEINHFIVVERDGMIIGCAAYYPYEQSKAAELACLAVHPAYQGTGRGDALLQYVEQKAQQTGNDKLFVLSTRSMHWFQERGFEQGEIDALPMSRQLLYNFQRKSKVFFKSLK